MKFLLIFLLTLIIVLIFFVAFLLNKRGREKSCACGNSGLKGGGCGCSSEKE